MPRSGDRAGLITHACSLSVRATQLGQTWTFDPLSSGPCFGQFSFCLVNFHTQKFRRWLVERPVCSVSVLVVSLGSAIEQHFVRRVLQMPASFQCSDSAPTAEQLQLLRPQDSYISRPPLASHAPSERNGDPLQPSLYTLTC